MTGNIRSQGRKKSLFPKKTTIPSGSQYDFVSSATNFGISFEDMLAQFGATGTLEQSGSVTATPVLDIQGSVNNIRNLEDGSGVLTSVSPENGITIEHNFDASQTGVPIMVNPTAASPTIVSLIAGTGIQLAASSGSIEITSTGATAPTNEIVVNVEGDFPVQDATTITLSAGVIYDIGADISTAKRFICEDGFVLTAKNQFGAVLTYTGTGDMFTTATAAGVGGTFKEVSLDSPNANQTFNMSDTSNSKILLTTNVSVVSTPKWGTYTGYLTVQTNSCSSLNADDGVTIAGSGQLVTNFQEFGIVSTSASIKLLDFGSSVVPNIELNNLVLVATGGFMISGVAANGNVPSGSLAMVSNSSVVGGASDLENITSDDFRWDFQGNSTIPNTRPDALVSIFGNATATTITASSADGSNAVKVAGTWTVQTSSHFTADATGRITYNGERDFTTPIGAHINVRMASGGSKDVAAYMVDEGGVIQDSVDEGDCSSSGSAGLNPGWQKKFSTGDWVEVWLENQSDTTNMVGRSGRSLVN